MNTPICDFVRRYQQSGQTRFHMPGHKGASFLGFEGLDLTEIEGADNLYHPQGIILESEANATALFGSGHTYFATGGSSQCIGAMLSLAMRGNGRHLVAARNVHKAFIHACALLDLDVTWVLPETDSGGLCSCPISPQQLQKTLAEQSQKPFAVYLTSPDYLGGIQDVQELSRVCEQAGVPLLVDNAHGAYLKFLQPSGHPLDLGAAMCCDSAHKTLPVLTGGAYLQISKSVSLEDSAVREALSLFGSTSPSYLVLQSLDFCNAYLADDYKQRLAACAAQVDVCKGELAAFGIALRGSEPLKLVLDAAAMGYSGNELAEFLRAHGMECEFADLEVVVLMATPETTDLDFRRLHHAMRKLALKNPLPIKKDPLPMGQRVCSIREAVLAPHEVVAVRQALGRVCGSAAVACPPAVPIAICGERITVEMIALFTRYGIETIEVVCGR